MKGRISVQRFYKKDMRLCLTWVSLTLEMVILICDLYASINKKPAHIKVQNCRIFYDSSFECLYPRSTNFNSHNRSKLPYWRWFSMNASFRRRGLGCVGFLLSSFLPRRCVKLSIKQLENILLSIITLLSQFARFIFWLHKNFLLHRCWWRKLLIECNLHVLVTTT